LDLSGLPSILANLVSMEDVAAHTQEEGEGGGMQNMHPHVFHCFDAILKERTKPTPFLAAATK
jgi:hypothetical protein